VQLSCRRANIAAIGFAEEMTVEALECAFDGSEDLNDAIQLCKFENQIGLGGSGSKFQFTIVARCPHNALQHQIDAGSIQLAYPRHIEDDLRPVALREKRLELTQESAACCGSGAVWKSDQYWRTLEHYESPQSYPNTGLKRQSKKPLLRAQSTDAGVLDEVDAPILD
jgi:hypothetical protein